MALSSDARLLGTKTLRFKSNSLHRIAMFESSRAALAHGHSAPSIRVALATLDTFLPLRERMKLNVPGTRNFGAEKSKLPISSRRPIKEPGGLVT